MKTQLNAQIALIPDEEIRNLTLAVLDAAPSCFWTMPASTTGKYHPHHSLGEGGLIRHTQAVVHFTCHLLDMEGITADEPHYSIAIAAAILHDCCKKSDSERYTAFDHPRRAAELTEHIHAATGSAISPHRLRTLTSCIASHMGRWNTDPRSGAELPRPLTPLQRLVHTADFLASRKKLLPF